MAGSSLEYDGRDLEAMSFAHNYYQWIVGIFAPYLRGQGIEIGAGSGTFSDLLLSHGLDSLIAVEPSPSMYALLREKFSQDARVVIYNNVLSKICQKFPNSFDVILYVNVLEHVEDDAQEMAFAHKVLKKDGHICLFVPALPWLYSDFDASVGHRRRYYKKGLEGLLLAQGFEIVRTSYFDFAGIWPWLIFFKMLRLKLTSGKTQLYDKYAVPFMRKIETCLPVPIGKNIIIVARKV